MTAPLIEARGLVKHYRSTPAVDNLSFDVRPGTVTGFLGPNGAGKSTTMRMIMGLDRPDAGQIRIGGQRYADLRWPLREVGALLEAKAFPPGPHRARPPDRAGRQQRDRPAPGPEGARHHRQGRTVLVSSHLISEMAHTADALIVIGRGRLLAQTTVARLSARGGSLEEAFFQLTGHVTNYPGSLS